MDNGDAMSKAADTKPKPEQYATEPLRETGSPFEPDTLYGEHDSSPHIPTARTMSPHIADLCERCRALIAPELWSTPPAAAERVQHFNETQTAYINTVGRALHQLTGDETYLTNRAFAIVTVCQLFLMSEPMAGIRNAWQVRLSRVERGAISRRDDPTMDTVQVIDPATDVPPVEPVAPPAPEPAPERAADMLYDEPGDGADLYPNRDGSDLYPKGDGDE